MLEQLRKQSVRRYEDRTTGSRQFHETARGYMPGGDTRSIAFWPPYPLYMESGTGCRITDVDGNRYIDFVNNYTSLILGHAHPAVQEAVAAQLPRGSAYASAIPCRLRWRSCSAPASPPWKALRPPGREQPGQPAV